MNKLKKLIKDSRVILYSLLLIVLFVVFFIIIFMLVVWILVVFEFGNVKIIKIL